VIPNRRLRYLTTLDQIRPLAGRTGDCMTVHIDIRQTDAAGMTDIQQWMLSVIAGDIQADVQQGHLT